MREARCDRSGSSVDFAMDPTFAVRMHVEQVEKGQCLATSADAA